MTLWSSRKRPPSIAKISVTRWPYEHCYAIFMVGKKRFAYFKRLSLHIYARFHPETWRKVRISGWYLTLKVKRKFECRRLPKIASEIRLWVKDLTRSKECLPTTRTSNFARVSENGVNIFKQIFLLLLYHGVAYESFDCIIVLWLNQHEKDEDSYAW